MEEGTEVWVHNKDADNFFRASIVKETSKDTFTVVYNDGEVEQDVHRKRMMVCNPNPGPRHC